MVINLNTSYVKVQLKELKEELLNKKNLNTSYVKVQHEIKQINGMKTRFKYILC